MVARAYEDPSPAHALVPVAGLAEALPGIKAEAGGLVVQGTVSRDGETLLTAFRAGEVSTLWGCAATRVSHRDALIRFKGEVDPEGILGAIG